MLLIEFRKSKNLTQSKAANELGVNAATFSRWENGERIARPDHITNIEKWSDGKVAERDHYLARSKTLLTKAQQQKGTQTND